MRRLLSAVLAALLLLSHAAGGLAAPTARSAPRAPALVRLAGLIRPVLPEIRALQGAKALAAFDGTKTLVLIERAPQASAPAGAASAKEILSAVNGTLADFSPEELDKLPADDLHGLAGMVLDQLQASYRKDAGAAVLLSEARARRIEALRGASLREQLQNPGHGESHGDMIAVSGVPEEVRRLKPGSKTVFRHYTSKENIKAILAGSALWNGAAPYVRLIPGIHKKSYDDVTGLFLTLPGVRGDSVGVPAREHGFYVDLKLPSALPVLEVEPGKIYVVPLPGRSPDWVRDYYSRWLRGEYQSSYDREMTRALAAEGGPGPKIPVPIKVVGHGRAK